MKTSTKKTVLVADDNEMTRELLTRLLGRDELEIETASNGHQAIGMVDNKDYDLIILDCHMPFAGGMDILRYLKNKKRDDLVERVIFISGQVDPRWRLPQGIKFFQKPFDLLEMKQVVATGLGLAS